MAASNAERVAAHRSRKKAEDAYVKKMMQLEPIVGADGIENARTRQEEYARWRFRGYEAGEIVSL